MKKKRSKIVGIIFTLILLLTFLGGCSTPPSNEQSVAVEQVANEPSYYNVGRFSEGLAYANKEAFGDYGYIDRDGNVVIDFQFRSAKSFSEGLAVVGVKGENGKYQYGYINKTGEMAIEAQYDYAESFIRGKAFVKQNFHEYIIDTQGNIIEELKD